MILFSVPNEASTLFSLNINNVSYQASLKWMDRSQSWYMDVVKGNDVIVTNMKLLPYVAITRRNDHLLPDGKLFIVSPSGTSNKIGRDNLGNGKDYELAYVSYKEFGL